MNANTTPTSADLRTPVSTPSATPTEVQRELNAFAESVPPPTEDEFKRTLADFGWLYDHWEDPKITAHRGGYVAVLDRCIVGFADDSTYLRLECAKRLHVHPARLAVAWIDDGSDLTVLKCI